MFNADQMFTAALSGSTGALMRGGIDQSTFGVANRAAAAATGADVHREMYNKAYDDALNYVTKMSQGRFTPSTGPATLCGIFVETNAKGLAARIDPVRVGGRLKQTVPILT